MELHALYGQEELTKARIARQRTGRAMIAVAAVGLAACVAVCCFATRQNQGVTLPLAVAAGAAGVGVGSAVNRLDDAWAMALVVRELRAALPCPLAATL